jgi:hypothetical protein
MGIQAFNQNSFFHPEASSGLADVQLPGGRTVAKLTSSSDNTFKRDTLEIKPDTLRDWVFRLKFIADEVGDARLLAAESELLDIRDEMDRLLD